MMSSHFERISAVLRLARRARGLSQKELSKQLGIGPATLSRAETTADVHFGTLQQIARALDLEPMLVPRRLVPAVDAVVRGRTPEDKNRVQPLVFDPDYNERYVEGYDEFPSER